jgi:hypothetical protein
MTFRTAFLLACLQNERACLGYKTVLNKARKRSTYDKAGYHARLWAVMERVVTRRYRKATGFEGQIDWEKVKEWLVVNLPALLELLFAVLLLF